MTTVRTFSSNNGLVEERRKQIIDATLQLMFRKGIQKTSIREIAKASNMTIGNLYHYIGSREDIIYLTFTDGVERYRSMLKDMNEQCNKMPPLEALTWAIDHYYRYHHDTRANTVFTFKEMSSFNQSFSEILLDASAHTLKTFMSILQRGAKDGTFVSSDLELVALTIQSMGEMWAIKRYELKNKYTLEEYVRLNTDQVFKLLNVK
jgi:TetR/AcrR family transcriptional regulator, cholesterol catabolism regulator